MCEYVVYVILVYDLNKIEAESDAMNQIVFVFYGEIGKQKK